MRVIRHVGPAATVRDGRFDLLVDGVGAVRLTLGSRPERAVSRARRARRVRSARLGSTLALDAGARRRCPEWIARAPLVVTRTGPAGAGMWWRRVLRRPQFRGLRGSRGSWRARFRGIVHPCVVCGGAAQGALFGHVCRRAFRPNGHVVSLGREKDLFGGGGEREVM